MKTAQDVGSPVEFVFLVGYNGEPLRSLATLVLVVDWPYEVTNGKWLIYPTEVLVDTGTVRPCHPPGDIINPLNLILSDNLESGGRRRREIEESNLPPDVASLATAKRDRSETTLTCAGGSARCVRFSCPLRDMLASATITVRGRIWNSTLLEDFRHMDRVMVQGGAELHLQTDVPAINMPYKPVQFYVSIDSELVDLPHAELPLWVIIVSVLSGVLLLSIIIMLLWKVGFFRRVGYARLIQTHHAVCIRPDERQGLCASLPHSQRHWVTSWKLTTRYY
ncbi:integrin alpha-3-like [Ascaphus truei]|uniref:integrin alpha-3-like n=1 Tax=Ascaphus truei TaxID=8439 RepID=UPI003F59605A